MGKSSSTIRRIAVAAVALALFIPCVTQAQTKPTASQPAVVGWRGDGTGHYPDATPPTEWYLKENGDAKNIVWKTKLPCFSWSTPVIVGDKIFTLSDPYDLICLSKKDGKLLWIRSFPPFVALTDEQKKANPAWKEVESLVADLQKLNDEFVAKGWSKELYKQKYDLQHKINDLTAKADKDYTLPKDMYVESWSGYTGSTPCSDGKSVFIRAGDGITARYDLDGNRKWALYKSLAAGWGEHGDAASPTIVGDLLLIHGKALDKETGKTVWTEGKAGGGFGILPFSMGGVDYAVAGGQVFRVRDGKTVPPAAQFTCSTPQIRDNILYSVTIGGGVSWYKLESQSNGDLKITNITPTNKQGYQSLYTPAEDESKKWESSNWYAASSILHEGLMYMVTVQGWFTVADVVNDKIVYQKHLPFDFKNPGSRKTWGMGLGSSFAMAGKYLYIMDSAGCTLVIEPGREYKQIAKNNIDFTVPDGWEPFHFTGAHHEQTEATPIFEGGRIYIRGEQFLYCVGEK